MIVSAQADQYSGTFTTTSSNLGGSVDYLIDLATDTMTLSNKTGDWLTQYGTSQTTTLFASNDFTTHVADIYPVGPTYDVTIADMASGFDALSQGADDGWYWISETHDYHAHTIIGGWLAQTGVGNNTPVIDDGTKAAYAVTTGGSFAGYSATSAITEPALVPEPTSSLLLGLGGLAFIARRKRD